MDTQTAGGWDAQVACSECPLCQEHVEFEGCSCFRGDSRSTRGGVISERGEIGPEMDFHAQSFQTPALCSFLFVLQSLIIPQLLLVKWSTK